MESIVNFSTTYCQNERKSLYALRNLPLLYAFSFSEVFETAPSLLYSKYKTGGSFSVNRSSK